MIMSYSLLNSVCCQLFSSFIRFVLHLLNFGVYVEPRSDVDGLY